MIKKAINTLKNGMVKSSNKLKQPEETYSFALNAIPNNSLSDRQTKVNEYGFSNHINIGKPYTLLNVQWLGDDEYVLFIKNPNYSVSTFNEIWLYNFKTFSNKLLYSNIGLNFSTISSMVSTYRIDYRGHRLVYFVDGFNDDRVIDIDDPNLFNLEVTSLSLNASVELSQPIVGVIDGNGYIKSGQYFVGVSYLDSTNYETQVSSFTRGISISNKDYNIVDSDPFSSFYAGEFANTNGTIENIVTNKALSIKIDNVDNRYTSLNLYIVQVTNTDTIIRLVKDIKVYQENVEFIYTGFEGEEVTDISVNDLLVPRINYYASEIINQKDNRLIRGNTKIKSDNINYQKFANNIKVTYEIEEQYIGLYNGYDSLYNKNDLSVSNILDNTVKFHRTNPDYLSNYGDSTKSTFTFMRDEVYSLGISLVLKDGSESSVFHIPGRPINTFVDNSQTNRIDEYGITNSASISNSWDTRTVQFNDEPIWKYSNSAAKRGAGVSDTVPNELGYWRSEETYPDGYDFPTNGEKDENDKSYVRHHRMPSDRLEPLYRTQIVPDVVDTVVISYTKRNIVLKFSNIVIPDEYKDIVSEVKIHYTPRTYNNRKVISKGLLYNTGKVTMNVPGATSKIRPGYMFNNFGSMFDSQRHESILQFISPEIDFKFKQFPILADKVKVLGGVKGYSIMHGVRAQWPSGNLYSVGIVNRELNNNNEDFDNEGFIQELFPMSNMYNIFEPFNPNNDISSSGIYNIRTINFIDGNYEGSFDNNLIDFRGEDPTSLISLENFGAGLALNPSYFPTLNLNAAGRDFFPNINYRAQTQSGLPISANHTITSSYYDSALYCSILRELPRQYGNPLSLQYVYTGNSGKFEGIPISVTVNNGDSIIEAHHTRKGYSTLMPESTYRGLYMSSSVENEYSATPSATIKSVQEIKTNSYITFITETDINIRMRRSPLENEGEPYYPVYSFNNPTYNILEKKTLTNEFFKIEDFYNNNHLNVNFINTKKIEDFQNDSDFRYKTRLIYSDKQNFEDKKDNYRLTRANNYKDLPMDRGPITQSFIKDNAFYVLTRDSLYNVYTSNSSLQALDSSNITVGTGEFFGLEPTEVMSVQGGFGGTSSKKSLNESPYGYLYVDKDKNKTILFNSGLEDINMAGLEENFNLDLVDQINDLEVANEMDNINREIGVISVYDPRLKRLLITKKDYFARQAVLDRYKGRFDNNLNYSIGDIVAKDGELVEITGEITEGPTVYAGEDQYGIQGNTILNGEVTPGTSPIASILWTQISGPTTASFLDNTSPITQVSNLLDGTYVFRLTAIDDASLSDYDEVTITSNLEMIYYGFNMTGNLPTLGEITEGEIIQGIPTLDIEVPFNLLDNSVPRYFWVAYKNTTISKDKWKDKFNIFNSGNIIDDQDLFEERGEVGNYKVVITNYPTQFVNPIIIYK